jgi:hypothetical protein
MARRCGNKCNLEVRAPWESFGTMNGVVSVGTLNNGDREMCKLQCASFTSNDVVLLDWLFLKIDFGLVMSGVEKAQAICVIFVKGQWECCDRM